MGCANLPYSLLSPDERERETAAFPGNVTEGHPAALLLRQPVSRGGWARRDAGSEGRRRGPAAAGRPRLPAAQLTFAGPRSAPTSTKRSARRGRARAHKGAAPRPRPKRGGPSAEAGPGRRLSPPHNSPAEGLGAARHREAASLLPSGSAGPAREEETGPPRLAPTGPRLPEPLLRAAARGPDASRKPDARAALRPRRGLVPTLLCGRRAGPTAAPGPSAGAVQAQGPGGESVPPGEPLLAPPRPLGLPPRRAHLWALGRAGPR